MKNLKKQKPERVWVLADFSFTLNRFLSVKILPTKALVKMTQTDVLSPRTFCPTDVLSLWMFCPHRRFVPTDVLSTDVLSPDVLSPDVLSGHRVVNVKGRVVLVDVGAIPSGILVAAR